MNQLETSFKCSNMDISNKAVNAILQSALIHPEYLRLWCSITACVS